MSKTHPPHREGEEKHPVRQYLKDLPKVNAPWYFEAKLQQRLQRRSTAGFSGLVGLWRPIPAYAYSVVAVLVLGVVGYYAFLSTDPSQNEILETPSPGSNETRESPKPRASSPAPPLTPQVMPPQPEPAIQQIVISSGQRGPSVPGTQQVIESPALDSQMHEIQMHRMTPSDSIVEIMLDESTKVEATTIHILPSTIPPAPVSVDTVIPDPDTLNKKHEDSAASVKAVADSAKEEPDK